MDGKTEKVVEFPSQDDSSGDSKTSGAGPQSAANSSSAETSPPSKIEALCTELGNARRLVAAFGREGTTMGHALTIKPARLTHRAVFA